MMVKFQAKILVKFQDLSNFKQVKSNFKQKRGQMNTYLVKFQAKQVKKVAK